MTVILLAMLLVLVVAVVVMVVVALPNLVDDGTGGPLSASPLGQRVQQGAARLERALGSLSDQLTGSARSIRSGRR